jgi:hypothetical protein
MDTNRLHPYDALMETYNSLKEDSWIPNKN